MNKQEQFDVMYRGVMQQGGPSVEEMTNGGRCLYRGPNDRKCAFGHLLSDELYEPEFEGKSADAVIRALSLSNKPAAIQFVNSTDMSFCRTIQRAHDRASGVESIRASDEEFLKEFDHMMRNIAHDYGLTVPELTD